MEKPINFLTASLEQLWVAYVERESSVPTFLAHLRDQTAAAAEAKVRGECAEDIEAIRCKYDEAVADFLHAKSRAERAEAERDALDKQVGELIKRVDEARSLYLAEKSKNADAKRKGAYEALTKFEERVFWYPGCLATLGNIRAFRDSVYAPTPARSVMPVQLPVVNVSDFYDAPAVIIRPEQARAIVALAEGK